MFTKNLFTTLFVCGVAALSLAPRVVAQESGVSKVAPKVSAAQKPEPSAKAKVSGKGKSSEKSAPKVVSLNKASASELESLPGVGPSIASRIVSYRSEQGKFSELSELLNVKGIGEKKLAQLRPYLTLD